MPLSSALYYPHIDVPNERWLRTAALFWDSVRTIVPASVRHPYSSDFARELSDEGILEPLRVSPEMAEIESLTDAVLDYMTDPAAAGVIAGFEGGVSVDIHNEKLPSELWELARIHPMKLPQTVRNQLEGALDGAQDWLRVSPEFETSI